MIVTISGEVKKKKLSISLYYRIKIMGKDIEVLQQEPSSTYWKKKPETERKNWKTGYSYECHKWLESIDHLKMFR